MPWSFDTVHSRVGFAVRHMMIATVRGEFTEFDGELQLDEQDYTRSRGKGTIQVSSIDTGNADRDQHLRSAEFFDAEQFPTITFETRRIEPVDEDHVRVTGDLTMHGVTRPITLDALITPEAKDPWGGIRRGVSLSGTLNRKDFGLTWNQALETGGVLLDDKVRLEIDLEVAHAPAQDAEKLAEAEARSASQNR
jgi:polyisoprenoid-binding protein YceI